ncbi:MAG: sensor histidine kinase [Ruminococcus sp.]|nr:sensor histidine kinase [Ruminococcus sp.]
MELFIIQLISSVLFHSYAFVLFEKLYTSKKRPLLLQLSVMAASAVIMALIGVHFETVLNFTYSFVSMLLINLLFYKVDGRSFLIFDAVFLFVMLIMEVLAVFLMAVITKVDNLTVIKEDLYLRAAATVLAWIFMIAITKILILIFSGTGINNIRTQELLMFLGLIVGEIAILNFLNEMIVKTTERYKVTVILLAFLAIDLYLTYLMKKISKSYRTEKELELVTQQSMMQLSAYSELNEKYNNSRRIIHDVRKHIASLDGLINANKTDEAERYKDLLNAELDKLVPRFECDSAILTVVINNKMETADSMKVKFRVDAEFTNIDFISNLDITTIFSNLLDNAFEACGELPENKRYVWLSITRRNYFVFIYVENTFLKVDSSDGKEFRTTKKYHSGLGLTNVRGAVEKYNGSFIAHTEDNKFITEVLIPIPDNN